MAKSKVYIAIDLKSFFASVECVERGLNPLTTNLVVADEERTDKTICLAVSPSLKKYGIPGRPRLFEVIQKVRQINAIRQHHAVGHALTKTSYDDNFLCKHPDCALDYIVAPPRMGYYIDYSTRIYNIYLKYVAPEDIHVYSIDEVFMDVTSYLHIYDKTPYELAKTIMQDVLKTVGITATAGIGTNLYLSKIAMDIVAKHAEPDENGARIAQLDESTYRKKLWNHEPLTDFWRIGRGYARKLNDVGLYTMGDVARCSIGSQEEYYNEDLLYDMFGVNAELLIDHAWGYEPCQIADIKAYRPENNSICSGQVLKRPYNSSGTRLVVREMTDMLALELVEKRQVTDQMVLTIDYDTENLSASGKNNYKGRVTTDRYGRKVPKQAHGTKTLKQHTSSSRVLVDSVMNLFDQIVDESLLTRKITISVNHVVAEEKLSEKRRYEQLSFFTDKEEEKQKERKKQELKKERKVQEAVISIREKFGKNAVLKGMSLEDGATAKERNGQIGGHKA